jgi:hypothetical protein
VREPVVLDGVRKRLRSIAVLRLLAPTATSAMTATTTMAIMTHTKVAIRFRIGPVGVSARGCLPGTSSRTSAVVALTHAAD